EASSLGSAKIVIEQALASINQTSRERFAAAQAMLDNALAAEPDNIDLQVALAALQTRGIQMAWFDTPAVSRWTWLLGAGWAYMLMGRAEEALPWLQRSIAITPASGRSHLLLAAAYQRLGRPDEAKAALAIAMELRPGSTALNISPPAKNTSPIYLE